MTYDTFHEGRSASTWQVINLICRGDGFSYYSSSLLADYIKKNCPEVENACHIYNGGITSIEHEKNVYHTYQLEVDSNFISMFNIIAIDGDNRLRLGINKLPLRIKPPKIFGEGESPIGKTIAIS